MSAPPLSPRLSTAVQDQTSGATGVARQVLDGLLELIGDPVGLHQAAMALPGLLPGYASMWHISRAARGAEPGPALRSIRAQLDLAVDRSVAATIELVAGRGGGIRTAPSSALVKAVVAALPHMPAAEVGPVAARAVGTAIAVDAAGFGGAGRVTGLAGADAISPSMVLNIRGTLDLARTMPTIVITTSLKLVPEAVFQRLGSPLFERIPLTDFEAVVLDGDVLTPAEAGRRAARLAELAVG